MNRRLGGITEFNFLKEFILDANEQLEKIEQAVINLEKRFSKNDIDELLRAFHTLKGNSSIVGLAELMEISHAVEGVIGDVKNNVVPMSPEITDMVLASVDSIKQHLKGGAVKNKQLDSAPLLAKIAKVRQGLKTVGKGGSASPAKRKLVIKTIDDLAILEIPDFFDGGYIHAMLESLTSLNERGIRRYVFNFRASRSVSSSGVSELAKAKKQLETLGAKAVSCEMPPVVEKAFRAGGENSEMNIKKTLKEAVGSI